jgi:hypothetical protein
MSDIEKLFGRVGFLADRVIALESRLEAIAHKLDFETPSRLALHRLAARVGPLESRADENQAEIELLKQERGELASRLEALEGLSPLSVFNKILDEKTSPSPPPTAEEPVIECTRQQWATVFNAAHEGILSQRNKNNWETAGEWTQAIRPLERYLRATPPDKGGKEGGDS